MHAAAQNLPSLPSADEEAEQRAGRRRHRRVALELPVELRHEDFHEPFGADSVDLSQGGLSLKGPFLPEVGDRLVCRFACPPDQLPIEVTGEVVWSEDEGPRRGELGMRFEGLDPREEKALSELVELMSFEDDLEAEAYDEAYDEGADESADEVSGARLHLDGVASPIDAQIVSREGRTLTVEQELPFLRVGMGVTLEEGISPERGELLGVELRVLDGVPRLALRVGLKGEAREASEALAPAIDAADATLRGDIEIEEPRADAHEHETPVVEVPSVSLYDVPRDDFADEEESDEEESDEEESDEEGEALEDDEEEGPALLLSYEDDDEADEEEDLAAEALDEPLQHAPLEGEESEPAPLSVRAREGAERAKEALGPVFARLVSALRGWWAWLLQQAGPALARAWARASGATRGALSAGLRKIRGRLPEGLGQKLGGLAGKLASKAKKRRTTAPAPKRIAAKATSPRRQQGRKIGAQPQALPSPRWGRRVALLSVIAFLGVGLTVFAFAGGSEEEVRGGIRSHRPVRAQTEATEPAQAHVEAQEPARVQAEAREAEAQEPAAAPVAVRAVDPRALPEARSEAGRMPPPTYPSLRDAQQSSEASSEESPNSEPAPAAQSSGRSFGVAEVPNGRAFTINMSRPIASLEGQATEAGFTVTVRGALALAGARSIASRHPGVERATILNRGDHAVLDIAFVAGQSPPYRVRARGRALEVTLGM